MEVELEKLLKEKEQSSQLALVPLNAVPISVTGTAKASTSTTPPTTDSSNELIKAMQEMSIQGKEIEKLKDQLKNLQEQKLKIDNSYVAELQKSHRLAQRIYFLESESVMAQNLAQAKENIWVDINQAITEIWPSIQIIFEQGELMQRSKTVIEVREMLGDKPSEATTLIKVLNSKTKEKVEELQIADRT